MNFKWVCGKTSIFIIWTITFFLSLVDVSYSAEWSYIDNGQIKMGVRLDTGATIGYFSEISHERNVLNHADTGRNIQQSYYGNQYPGVYWGGMEWCFNPVQGGDWHLNPSTVVEYRNEGDSFYAKIIPKDWALNNVDTDSIMEEWITLTGDVAHIHFKFTYTGTEKHVLQNQEVPAAFFDLNLSKLVYYKGNDPWTNAPLTREVPPFWLDAGNQDTNIDENWAAYVDDTDWGCGVYVPGINFMTYYRSDGPAGPEGSGCSYFAPLEEFGITPGFVYEYDVYLYIGTVAEIRSKFYEIYLLRDEDADGMADNWEIAYFGDLSHDGTGDSEPDGLTDLEEFQNKTDPTNPDSDGDGMPDGWEVDNRLNPLVNDADNDPDNDGLTTLEEYRGGSDPRDRNDPEPQPPITMPWIPLLLLDD